MLKYEIDNGIRKVSPFNDSGTYTSATNELNDLASILPRSQLDSKIKTFSTFVIDAVFDDRDV